MAAGGMVCPHCGEDQVFEATEKVSVLLSFDGWRVGSIGAQVPKDLTFACIGCGGWVGLDYKNRLIHRKSQPVPIFDDDVKGILEFAKKQEGGEVALESTLHTLAEKNYRGLSFLTTWKKLISIILEQRP